MKHLKTLCLAAVAAAALIAIAGSGTASATVLCKENLTPCEPAKIWPKNQAFKSSLEAGTEAVFTFKPPLGTYQIKCQGSTMNGEIVNAGGEKANVIIELEPLTLENCGCPVTVLKDGALSVEHVAGTMNGSLTSANMEVTFQCMEHCIYGDGKFGTLTAGAMGTIDVSATMNKIKGGVLCPATATWAASYTVTAPEPIYVAEK
jgi:hypothetical protein